VCTRCTAPCDYCENSLNSCISCLANWYLKMDDYECTKNCSTYKNGNYYEDSTNNMCMPCNLACLKCFGAS